MKNFLISISKEIDTINILEQSNNLETLNNNGLALLLLGEIFNRKELLTLLKIDDEKISNSSLISIAYQSWGISLLKKIEGAFSLIIQDKNENQLHVAKDKIGAQALYFTTMNNAITIGTHLKSFQKIKEMELIVNPNSLGNYLQFGFILQPQTIFKECYKVQAGECITFDLNTHQKKASKYWTLGGIYNEEKNTQEDETTILNQAHNLLQKAVEESMNNGRYALSLSGGYDSSTLAAITQKLSPQKVDTFTIGFEESEINEAPYAKAIAAHLGTNHHEHYFTAADALELIPKMCTTYDEPFADQASAPTMITAELLKKHKITNLIAGDGGDEVFATAEDVHFFGRVDNTPNFLKKILSLPLEYTPIDKIPFIKSYNNLPKKVDKLKNILNAKNISEMVQAKNTLFLEEELTTHIKGYTHAIETSFNQIEFGKYAQTVDEIIGTYFITTMTDGELVKSYSAVNQQEIKLSMPFLNTALVNYMAKVPASIKIKDGIKKYLLKEISECYLPKQLMERPKSGFSIPLSSWMKKELKDILYSQINGKRLDKDNIFYTSFIINIRDQFYAGNDAYKYKLWRIFIFQLWYENFTDSKNHN